MTTRPMPDPSGGERLAADASPDFQALILAGGQSRRMGQDKAMLSWQGQSLLEHMVDVLQRAGARRIWRSGPYTDADALPDIQPGLGPLGGLSSLAHAAEDGVYLVVPVDMPLLDVGLLKLLPQALSSSAVEVGAMRFSGFVLPMALRLDATNRAVIEHVAAGEKSARSLRALHQALAGSEIPVPEAADERLRNCNTPEEWRELSRLSEACE